LNERARSSDGGIDSIEQEYLLARCGEAARALRRHGFEVWVESDEEKARERVLALVPPDAVVGCPGSVTTRQIGAVKALADRGNRVVEHSREGLSKEEILALRREELRADVFLTGVNAVTLDGRLVSVDGAGNRVAGMMFGPPKVVVVAGGNKVVRDVEAALERIRSVAAPQNSLRLGLDLPCAKTGACHDCSADGRICRVTVVMERPPMYTDVSVIMVGRRLGY